MGKDFLKKTLFYGGAFNPIHNGHLIAARVAAEKMGLNRVCLIPAANPAHKVVADLLPYDERVRLCNLAVGHPDVSPHIDVMDIENQLKISEPVYTIDTVRFLRNIGYFVYWQIGADCVNNLPTWHKIEELVKECHFVITERPGHEIHWRHLPAYLQHLKANIIEVPLLNISASEIRQRAKQGKSIYHFVPDEVARQIAIHRHFA